MVTDKLKTGLVHLLLCAVLFLPGLTEGQEKKILTYDESIQYALTNSYEIINFRQDLERDILNLKGARAALKSNAQLDLDIPAFDETLSEEFNSQKEIYEFYRTKTLTFKSNMAIFKPLPTDGKVSVNNDLVLLKQSGNERDYKNKIFLAFQQPLFTPNVLIREIKHKEIRLERTRNEGIRRMMNILYNISRSFFNLEKRIWLLSIDSSNVALRKENYRIGQERFEKNEIDEMEFIQLEVDYTKSKNSFIVERGDLQRSKNSFKQLIGMELTDEFEIQVGKIFMPLTIDMEEALSQALRNRPEIKNKLLDIELHKLHIEEVDSRNEFKARFYSAFGFEKANSSWKGVFENFDKTRNVSFHFSVPIWDWGKNKAEVKAVEFSFEQLQLELDNIKRTIRRQVQSVYRELESAENRVKTLSRSQDLAAKSYRLSLQKFEEGELSAQEIDLSLKRLIDVKKAFVEAFIDYKTALANLKRLTLYDFEKNSPITELE